MKSIYQNTVKAGLLGAAVLLGFTACTDDHFDIQPSTVSGSNTIGRTSRPMQTLILWP